MARPAHYEASDVRIDKYVVGPFENNVFIVRCKQTGEAVLLDAANEHELLLKVSRATGVRRVLTTHGHWDHIQAVVAIRDAGIDVGIAPDDAAMLPGYDFTIPDDELIAVGDLRLRTIHTPGHTPGNIALLMPARRLLIAGDSAGRFRRVAQPLGMYTEDPAAARTSIRKLAELDFDAACFGHGRPLRSGANAEFRRLADRLPA